MAGKTPPEAVHNFLTPLQRALSCVSQEILTVRGGYHPSASPHALTLGNSPAMLGGDRRFALKVIQHYRIIEHEGARGPWKVRTVAYYYTVGEAGEHGREMFAYHWHPSERTAITYPHFHLYQGAGPMREDVRKAHFPTGRIAFEDVLRLLITQFGVLPFRDDWEAILDQTQTGFEDWQTWR
jgi:hypothetical protein